MPRRPFKPRSSGRGRQAPILEEDFSDPMVHIDVAEHNRRDVPARMGCDQVIRCLSCDAYAVGIPETTEISDHQDHDCKDPRAGYYLAGSACDNGDECRCASQGQQNRGRRAKAKQPMTTRRRAALLKKLGYEKAPFVMTRGTTMWIYKGTRAKMTIVNGGKGDEPFMVLGGPYGFTSNYLFVGNLAAGAWSQLLQWQQSGEVDVPSFEHDSMMDAFEANKWPQPKDVPAGWIDDLFIALATSSAAAGKRLKLARVDWDGDKSGQSNRGRRSPLFIRRE